jgi:multidrug efflux system membrane fusion protein
MKLLLKILLPVLMLAVMAGLTVKLVKSKEELKPQPRVETLPLVEARAVKAGVHRFQILSQGEIRARTEINLVAEVPGKIVSVSSNFTAGGFFEDGEVLARLDSRDFEVAVAQAEAALAQGRVRLDREKAEALVARREWESLGRGEANPLLLREPQLAEAEALMAAAEANLRKAKLDLSRCEIRAPFGGRVREKMADIGQFVGLGSPLGRVYAVDFAEVRLPIPLSDLEFIDLPLNGEAGAGVGVKLTARVGGVRRSWRGELLGTEGTVHQRTRMVSAIARVDDPYARSRAAGHEPLPVGMFVEAVIEGREMSDLFRVPRSAFRGEDTLVAVDTMDRLRFRTVDVVRRVDDSVLIRSGLEEGDRVCVSLLDGPVDGMSVRVRETDVAQ